MQPSQKRPRNSASDLPSSSLSPENLDSALPQLPTAKKAVVDLERAINKNTLQRAKFASDPEKFVESEIALLEALHVVRAFAADLDTALVQEFIHLKTLESLLQLLQHDNVDIAILVVSILQDFTDQDEDLEEELEQEGDDDEKEEKGNQKNQACKVLVKGLVDKGALEALVLALRRFITERNMIIERNRSKKEDMTNGIESVTQASVDEETQAIYNTFAVFENFLDIRPESANDLGVETDFWKIVVDFIPQLMCSTARSSRARGDFDANALYASEIAAIVLQTNRKTRLRFGSVNGIHTILKVIAPYQNIDVESLEEEEFVENMFDCLCSALMEQKNKALFLQDDGIQWALLIMKKKVRWRNAALRVLDFAVVGSPQAAHQLVKDKGLGVIFAVFMNTEASATFQSDQKSRKNSKKKKSNLEVKRELEEHLVSIISFLLRELNPEFRLRLEAKFRENTFEKLFQLFYMYLDYYERDQKVQEELKAYATGQEMELDEDEQYLNRLDEGLFTLQHIALVIGCLLEESESDIAKAAIEWIEFKKIDKRQLVDIIREYRSNYGGDDEENADDDDLDDKNSGPKHEVSSKRNQELARLERIADAVGRSTS